MAPHFVALQVVLWRNPIILEVPILAIVQICFGVCDNNTYPVAQVTEFEFEYWSRLCCAITFTQVDHQKLQNTPTRFSHTRTIKFDVARILLNVNASPCKVEGPHFARSVNAGDVSIPKSECHACSSHVFKSCANLRHTTDKQESDKTRFCEVITKNAHPTSCEKTFACCRLKGSCLILACPGESRQFLRVSAEFPVFSFRQMIGSFKNLVEGASRSITCCDMRMAGFVPAFGNEF